jgi:hypothetical protein
VMCAIVADIQPCRLQSVEAASDFGFEVAQAGKVLRKGLTVTPA